MPDHRVRIIPGIDAQLPLPGVVLELQFAVMLEHPLTATLHPQLAFLLTNLAVQLVVTLRPVEPRQRYLTDITNTPIGVQCLAQLARQAVLMFGAQAQLHAFAKVRMQVHLPVAQLQLPVQAHAVFVMTAIEQLPVQQTCPAM